MHKYNVAILQPAWDDLADISDYYIAKFSVESAKKVTDSILHSLEPLQEFPFAYNYVPDEELRSQGYRKVICGKFVSIYRIINNDVYIYHIAHTSSEYPKLFK